jgi:ribosomal protein S18 acetylase RimI-like enzyme
LPNTNRKDSGNLQAREERRREIRLRRGKLINNQDRSSVTYKIAQEASEFEDAFELVWDSYVKVGLQADDGMHLRITKYHLLPSTKVLVAIHRPELDKKNPDYDKLKEPGIVVGTLTLVLDSPLGLPMEEICCQEVAALRNTGRSVAEVIALAVNPDFRKDNIMMYLYKLMFQYARYKGVTDLACSVTKKHIKFYRRMLLFKPMGELKKYSAANQLETQCHRLDLQHAEQKAKDVYHSRHFDADLYTFFFTENPSAGRSFGEGSPWSRDQLGYFIEQRTRLLATLDERTRDILRQEYAKAKSDFPF